MKKAINSAIFILGFSAMGAQIVFLREFLITFYGNEFSLGFVLSAWLLLGAIGSLILGRITDKLKQKTGILSFCQISVSILLVIALLAIRLIKPTFNIISGEIVPLSVIVISGFIVLLPLCVIFGFMFALACKIYQSQGQGNWAGIAKVYTLETSGAIAAGLLVSLFLISLLKAIYIISILAVLNILSALFLALTFSKSFRKVLYCGIVLVLFITAVSLYFLKGWERLDRFSLAKQWQGFWLIANENSIYGNITFARNKSQTAFFDNGLFLYAIPDREMAENAVHFALLEHQEPKDVLLAGAGLAGLIKETLKHPVINMSYVELDPLLIKMAKEYFSADYLSYLKDKRLSIENIDARRFIKNTDKKYDCVLINLGDPLSAQLNRYYTLEFFKEVKSILKDKGILSFKVSSSENYINADLKKFLQSLHATLKKIFNDVKVIPGDVAIFLASPQSNVLTYDYKVLEQRSKERNLDIKYVRDYYLFSKLSPQRIDYLEKALKENPSAALNFDFRPSSYFYATIFWLSHFRDSGFNILLKAVNEKLIWQAFLIIIFFMFLIALKATRNRNIKNIIMPAVFIAGFSQMVFQIVIILTFQFIYGYLFYSLGFLLTAFMTGLAWGALIITKRAPGIKNEIKIFIYAQTAIFIYCLILPLFLKGLSLSMGAIIPWLGANILFPLASLACGFIGGLQFTLANKIYLKDSGEVGKTAGLLYGVDLLGACLGAFSASIFLIPLLGIIKACLLLALINLIILALLISQSFNRPAE
jgi:spermidine synthase